MPVRLTIRPPRTNKPRVVEFDEARVTIGRSSKCDIRLPFGVVSGHHLTIIHSANSLQVRDEQSTNGTMLDGEPLVAGAERRLAWGAKLEIVDLSIEVELVPDLDAGVSLGKTGTMARLMLGEALLSGAHSGSDESGAAADQELESAYFEVTNGPAEGQKPQLPDDLERGRIADDEDALISLPGLSVALEIYRDGDGFGLRLAPETRADQKVAVNDTALTEDRRLTSGDMIAAGHTELRFVDPLEAYLDELDGVIPPDDLADTAGVDETSGSDASERAVVDTLQDAGSSEAEPTAPVERERSKPKNPDSSKRSLSVVEVGVIAVSVVVLAGVIYLLLAIFGVL